MPNITLSIDEATLKKCRQYARAHNTSLNAMVRDLLRQRVGMRGPEWAQEFFARCDALEVDSGGVTWSRDDLYDV
jgi:hypothetical protein